MKLPIVLASLILVGCAGKVTSSTPRSVIIDAGNNITGATSADAQRMADAECAKHGRFAKMTGRPDRYNSNDYVFECIQ
jgi:hypothetical protein